MTEAYNLLFTIALAVLGVLLFLCLLRAILALMLGEGYLVDIAIIYAMLSFLAVVVLAKIYIGVYLARKAKEGDENER